MSGTYPSEAIVLRKRPLGEADVIVGLLSPQQGRFDAVARGARRSSTARGGKLEPFNHVRLLVAQGRTLDVIAQVELIRSWRGIAADLQRLATGTYFLELYSLLVEPGPNASAGRLFNALLRSLQELEAPGALPCELVCRRGELRLLTVLGVAPHLDACVQCGATDGLARFLAEEGGVLCRDCFARVGRGLPFGADALLLLRVLRLPDLALVGEACADFGAAARAGADALMRAHMEWHWPAHVRSRRFLEQVSRT